MSSRQAFISPLTKQAHLKAAHNAVSLQPEPTSCKKCDGNTGSKCCFSRQVSQSDTMATFMLNAKAPPAPKEKVPVRLCKTSNRGLKPINITVYESTVPPTVITNSFQ